MLEHLRRGHLSPLAPCTSADAVDAANQLVACHRIKYRFIVFQISLNSGMNRRTELPTFGTERPRGKHDEGDGQWRQDAAGAIP